MTPRRRRALLLWAIGTAIAVVTMRPWSGFVGHSHWALVEWVPFTVVFSARDLIANIALFVPFGLAFGWRRRRPPMRRALALATLLSLGIELYQVYCHNHFPTTADVLANALGGWLGARMAWGYSRLRPRVRETPLVTRISPHPRARRLSANRGLHAVRDTAKRSISEGR